ncbi:MAG: hypothetical protein VX127_09020 [Myxococcota bacterium]|nr:hypothetical protein [Myxococcota bacterium]
MTNAHQNLNHLSSSSLGIQWLQGMARAGIRRTDGGEAARMYELAQELDELDDKIAETFVGEQLFFPLPNGWWIWVPLLYSGGFLWALRHRAEATDVNAYTEERMSIYMMFCVALAVISMVVLGIKFFRERDARLRKQRQRPTLVAARDGVRNELVRLRDALGARTQAN